LILADYPLPSAHAVGIAHFTFTEMNDMIKFLLWLMLFFFCWPLAIIALILYPVVWLLLLPFRILGFAVDGVLGLIKSLFMLPARILRGPQKF
jgi:hypothetical protein